MNYKLISCYRSAVMGFAILWIMVYHSGISFSALPVFGAFLNDFRSLGYGGVDIFLFLSGFGLYRALAKKPGQLAFYKRRLQRVMPAYLPVLAVWLCLNLPKVPPASWPRAILGNLTGTAFWLHGALPFNWYMLALFAFYFIAPFFFRVMDRPGGAGWLIAATLVLDACFFGDYVMIAVSRFTVFAIGMALGRWTAGGGELKQPHEALVYLLGALGYGLLLIFRASLSRELLRDGGFYWYSFILSAPALVFLLCRLFSWLDRRASWVVRGFALAGECSLEIYLIHIVAFDYIHPQSNKAWPFVYAAMVLFGYIYHTAIAKAEARLSGLLPHGAAKEAPLPREKNGGQKTYIEFLRIAAAFLVIVNHTNSRIFSSNGPSPTWLISLTYFFICKIAVPLFLFIMGALLLEKEDSPEKSKKRLFRIFVVSAVGSACYYGYYKIRAGAPLSLGEFLLNLPKSPATNAFWYLYLYLGLLCLLPVLQRLVKALSRRQLEYLLFLSLGVLGTVPLISSFLPDFQLSKHFTAGLIGPYVGQVLLGYYMERYVPANRENFRLCACGFLFAIVFQVAATYMFFQSGTSPYRLDNRVLITITGSAACFYVCVKYLFSQLRISQKLNQAFFRLGALTFGIYLSADMVLDYSAPLYGRLCGHMHVLPAMLLWELFIFAAAALITAALRLVPFLRKWL